MVAQIVWQIVIMVISAVVSYATRTRPQDPKAATLEDFDVPTIEEGRPMPVVFGTCWIKSPGVTWYGDLSVQPIKKSSGK